MKRRFGGDSRVSSATPYELELQTNAYKVSMLPGFTKVHIFHVTFTGGRTIKRTDEALKRRLLSASNMLPALGVISAVSYTIDDGAYLYVVGDDKDEAQGRINEASGSVVTLGGGGGGGRGGGGGGEGGGRRRDDDEWIANFQEVKSSPLVADLSNPTLWMQFLNAVSLSALSKAEIGVSDGNRLVLMDDPNWKQMRNGGQLIPSFAKAIAMTENGAFWTFAPRWTVLLRENAMTLLQNFFRERPELKEDEKKRRQYLRKQKLVCSSSYLPRNLYEIVDISDDVKATDEIEIREFIGTPDARGSGRGGGEKGGHGQEARSPEVERRRTDDDFRTVKTTHIEYLRKKYGRDFPELRDPRLDRAPMAACRLLNRKNNRVGNAKMVHIPAPLLNVMNTKTAMLPKPVKEEITRASQRKPDQVITELRSIAARLKNERVAAELRDFSLEISSKPELIKGTNSLYRTVQVTLAPPLEAGGGSAADSLSQGSGSGSSLGRDSRDSTGGVLELERDSGSFEREFQNCRRHSCKPVIGAEVGLIYHQRLRHDTRDRFCDYMSRKARDLGWDLNLDLNKICFHFAFATPDVLDRTVPDLLRDFASNRTRVPRVIFALIPTKDDDNYIAAKRFAYRLDVPSQVVTEALMDRLQNKPFWKITASLAGKLLPPPRPPSAEPLSGVRGAQDRGQDRLKQDGERERQDARFETMAQVAYPCPWRLTEKPAGVANPNVCVMGIATYTSDFNRNAGVGGFGMVATCNEDCTGVLQEFGSSESLDSSGIMTDMKAPLTRLMTRLASLRKIEQLVCYRRGISAGAVARLKVEIDIVKDVLATVLGSRELDEDRNVLRLRWDMHFHARGHYQVSLPLTRGSPGEGTGAAVKAETRSETVSIEGEVLDADETTGKLEIQLEIDMAPFEGWHVDPAAPITIKLPAGSSSSSTSNRDADAGDTGNVSPKSDEEGAAKGDAQQKLTVVMAATPSLAYIVANNSHNANLMFFKNLEPDPRDRRQSSCLTPCGTIVDKFMRSVDQLGNTRPEFYIVPGPGVVGFSQPIHYMIVEDTLKLSLKDLQDLTLRLSFLFYNQQGCSKGPHVLKIAANAAEKGLAVYRGIQRECEDDYCNLHNISPDKVKEFPPRRLLASSIFL